MTRHRATTCTLFAGMAALCLHGCALSGPKPSTAAPATPADCVAIYAAFDRLVTAAGVGDAQAAHVAGAPYLRVDRLLASYHGAALEDAALEAWMDAAAGLARTARRIELANLPDAVFGTAATAGMDRAALAARLDACAATLRAQGDSRRMVAGARVPAAYDATRRLLGLYPLTRAAVLRGVARLHARSTRTFATPLADLPRAGELLAFAPPAAAPAGPGEVAHILASARDALGVPRPRGAALARLFALFAPRLVVDVATAADRIGAPLWTREGLPDVDPGRPTVYRLLSHARFGDAVLAQLNYVVWFAARPPHGSLDLLGGRLDGITMRVTVDTDGTPLLIETMHNCGCYHMFFPGPRLERTVPDGPAEEPLWIPQRAPLPAPGQRLVLHLAHGTHYVVRLDTAAAGDRTVDYVIADYDLLRSLETPAGARRSLFGPAGLVAGTERAERWLLWPMGIRSAGAMRQWGQHATAFVGQRHFDAPDLVSRYFARASP
ncbi:MAG: hypothetical protein IT495_00945 [Gammaproteobacteria bacterium]|nr:hypothetical protein [Gammaproteobacteria bacterium]